MAELDTYKSAHDGKNFTDPQMVFDRTLEYSKIVQFYSEQDPVERNNNAPAEASKDSGISQERFDGIYTPILKINNLVVTPNMINSLTLTCKDFLPTITVEVLDNEMLKQDIPNMSSNITLVLLPPIDGAYKKISIDFHIDNTSYFSDGSTVYTGTCYFPKLWERYIKPIKGENGNKLTTYETIEAIAKDCQLGFACTDKCKDINDTNKRLLMNETYIEFINKHIRFGGLDKDSIFDCWLDFRGNIVLINKSWVMDSVVQPDDLDIKVLKGFNIPNNDIDPDQSSIEFEEQVRTFANYRFKPEKDNMQILEYTPDINNSYIINLGTENTYYAVNHYTIGGSNGMIYETMKIVEDSIDGDYVGDVYAYPQKQYIGVELANKNDGNTPILLQQKRYDTRYAKWNSRKLDITLTNMNFGIERGMIISVLILEYDANTKKTILANLSNIEGDPDAESKNDIEMSDEMKEQLVYNDKFGIPNVTLSGMYYVDGMTIDYKDGEMTQTLTLLKKGRIHNLFNKISRIKMGIDEEE